MPYEFPPLEQLENLIAELESSYQQRKIEDQNIDRLLLLQLLSTLKNLNVPPEEKENLIRGGLIFALKIIKDSAYNPLGGVFNNGSEIYKKIVETLTISKTNYLPHPTRIIYLTHLYHFLKENDYAKNLVQVLNARHQEEVKKRNGVESKSCWPTDKALIEHVEASIKYSLHQYSDLKGLLKEQPAPNLLKTNLKKVVKNYRASEKKKSRMHLLYADLIDFVVHSAEVHGIPNSNVIDNEYIKEISEAYKLQYAVGLFIMGAIEAEYENYHSRSRFWGWVPEMGWKPENSDLYCACQAALNINRITDISERERANYLFSLKKHLKVTDKFEQHKKALGISEELMTSIKQNLGIIKENLLYQMSPLQAAFVSQDGPKGFSGKSGAKISHLTQFGINSAASRTATNIVTEASRQTVIDAATGVGLVVGGPGGAIIGRGLGMLFTSHVMPLVISATVVSAIEPIVRRAGEVTGAIVAGTCRVTASGVEFIFNSKLALSEQEKRQLLHDQAFLQALLSLPSHLFSQFKKTILENTQEIVGMHFARAAAP